jgi:hypothetical protein
MLSAMAPIPNSGKQAAAHLGLLIVIRTKSSTATDRHSRRLLKDGGDARAGSREYGGHLSASEGDKMLDHNGVELCAAGI